ncbi:retrovirus-related pol polyprotein from transposon TNT 1-94 [Tanacetum coccineum]
MSASNQQNLADSGANERPLMLEKRNYIPWESRFRWFLDNKLEEGEWMWHSVEKGPYVRPMIPDPDDTRKQIIEPLSKMTEINKKQYIADVRVMNYLLQAIPNDIYNSVDVYLDLAFSIVFYVFAILRSDVFDQNMLHILALSESFKSECGGSLYTLNLEFLDSMSFRRLSYLYGSEDGRVDIQIKNAGYGGNDNRTAGRQNRNQAFNVGNGNNGSNQIVQHVPRTESNPGKANVQCYNCIEKGHYARDCQKPRVRDANYFREQMLLAMKHEARTNLKDEENDFMLYNSFGDETLEELTAAVIMMTRIQPADENVVTELNYDAKVVSEVNASHKVHEQANHVKRKTIIHTYDDQIDSNIIFDDPYVENNGGTFENDSNAYGEYHDVQILAYHVHREAENQKRLNNELKKKRKVATKRA